MNESRRQCMLNTLIVLGSGSYRGSSLLKWRDLRMCATNYNVDIFLLLLIMKERLENHQCRMYDSVLETWDQLSFSYTLTAPVQYTKGCNIVCRIIHKNFFIQSWACHGNMSNSFIFAITFHGSPSIKPLYFSF